MTIFLDARGYEFEIDIDGNTRRFHVGTVCIENNVPTSVHINEFGSVESRTTLGIHLPKALWRPAKGGGLEDVCRKAISLAIREGWFRVAGHYNADYFDEDIESWPGELVRI
ncbi:hypothetical protein SB379_06905 [Burkholderia multivorans]|uniref:hypothetical protein n=1 Tax=Burkholderia multivorans TaxID=87883 RepID=UPI000D458BF7|nr:hypothetical protein [Burkholderia multivorans]MBR8020183.1 hypothetical protein [Burkholderia multivorans]MEB2511591.1 hypothetical protein [Burkholderia multivorans]MEB2521205.1 hypothetical protein [Burkholderia multivorans]MEB2573384.1 hypothetical protein [Burkholderia multivorans]MEB2590544.1 hypothetical protein [Burkholderia multivorans]